MESHSPPAPTPECIVPIQAAALPSGLLLTVLRLFQGKFCLEADGRKVRVVRIFSAARVLFRKLVFELQQCERT